MCCGPTPSTKKGKSCQACVLDWGLANPTKWRTSSVAPYPQARVCWVFGEEKEDSPRLWEASADLTACGCLVVQSVCIINC